MNFEDRNANGVPDAGEGLEGWGIELQRIGTTDQPEDILRNPDGSAQNDGFGVSVAAVGDNRFLVGAPLYGEDAGAAFLYEFDGSQWYPVQVFPDPNNPTHPTLRADDWFGFSVAALGNRVLIGAVILFTFNDSTAEWERSWVFPDPAADPTHPIPAQGDNFGISIAALGSNVVVGAFSGAAYLIDGAAGELLTTFRQPPEEPGYSYPNFGQSVASAGADKVLIGVRRQRAVDFLEVGVVYLFNSSGECLQTFRPPRRRICI